MRHEARFRAYRRPRLSGTTVPYIDSKTWGKVGANCHIFKVVDVKHRYWDRYALGLYQEFDVTLVAGEQVIDESLYGPASLRDKTLIYPCEAFKCQIGCACQMCRMKLSACDDFDDHLTFHLSNHTMCKYCNEVERLFPYYSYNVVHKRDYPNPYAWCGGQPDEKVFYDTMGSASLFEHTSWYSPRKPPREDSLFTCDKCDKKFKMLSHLKRHEVAVHYRKKKECQYCGFQSSRKDNLVAHMKLMHESETDPQFKCDVCSESFHKKSHLVRHSKHLKSNCSICSDIFCTLKQLQQHTRLSHPKYVCGKCGKGFKDQANLDKHQSTGTSPRTKCEVCNKEHCTILEMKKHRKTHETESFQCNYCNKMFASKFCHKRHCDQRSEHKCAECGENLCNKQELKMHISLVHNVKSCEICCKIYDLKNYKYHMYSEHQQDV
jgi:hypothetical protein